MSASINSDVLRGHTDTVVLGTLLQQDRYGFEIYKTIIEKSLAEFELKEATLYSSYKRLEKGGYILAYWGDETQGARRKYYRITDSGRKLYAKNKEDWLFTQKILKRLLEED